MTGEDVARAKRARKVEIQRQYLARKKANATPEQLEAMAMKQREYSAAYYHKDINASRKSSAARAMRSWNKKPAAERTAINAANRERNGQGFNRNRRMKYAADPDAREKHRAGCALWAKVNAGKRTLYARSYWAQNKKALTEYRQKRRSVHPALYAASAKKSRLANLETVTRNIAAWRAANPGYANARYSNDPAFRLATILRSRLAIAVDRARTGKAGGSFDLIGCDIETLRLHLEAQFKPGMTWENLSRHGWHVDHIKPVCKFDLSDPAQQFAAFHWSNLRPLWASENLARPRALWVEGSDPCLPTT